jgi:hypothetical protein
MPKADSNNITTRRVGAKPDPMVGLVERAGTLLDEYVKAYNKLHRAEDKLKGPRWAFVSPPDTFLPCHWGINFRFSSVGHIEKEMRKVGRAFRKGWAGSNNCASGPPKKAVDAVMRKSILTALPEVQRLLVKEFREKDAQVLAAKQKLGLPGLTAERNKASAALLQITKQIAKTKPVTAMGALAAIEYVRFRLSREDLADLFAADHYPGKFDRVLRAAHAVLRRATGARGGMV